MSKIVTNTIETSTGGPVTLTKQQAAKQWSKFNASGTLDDSFNTSTITDVDTGSFQINITNAMSNANYSNLVGIGESGTFGGNWFCTAMLNIHGPIAAYQAPTTTTFRFACVKQSAASYNDPSTLTTSVNGDLA